VAVGAVTAVICELKYWETSCSKGSGGNFVGDVGESGGLLLGFEGCGTGSCLREAGEGERRRLLLRVLSRSTGSLYEEGGL
jgi:hypothetical protein